MDFNNLIDKNVDKIFKTANSLTVDVEFSKKTFSEFDFGNSEASYTEDTVSIRGFVFTTKKKTDERVVSSKSLMVQKKDIGNLSSYDTVSINGTVWGVGDVIKDDNYIIEFELKKEG